METMQELIPFAKEMLSQRPGRGMVKVYLIGSVLAVLGTVIGLVETVCQPFSSGQPLDDDMLLLMAREGVTPDEEERRSKEEKEEVESTPHGGEGEISVPKPQRQVQRKAARLHAS